MADCGEETFIMVYFAMPMLTDQYVKVHVSGSICLTVCSVLNYALF